MNRRSPLFALPVALLLLSLLLPVQGLLAQPCDSTTVSYTASDSNFANPERGMSTYRDIGIGSPSLVQSYRQNYNVTVIQRIYTMPQFNDGPISSDYLSVIENDLQNARLGGAKLVMRFSYTDDINGADAPLQVILDQIDQLQPIFEANHDVIAYLEAGFIGAWGEWYYSTNNLNNTEDRRTVLFALLDALPVDRTVAVRTPNYKMAVYNSTEPLGPDSAFSGSHRARTGAHNDCFLASSTDYGTYQDPVADKLYLHQDNRYVPQGGETCNPNSDYANCTHAMEDMPYMHWSLLNKDYHPGVLDNLETGGCLPQIKRRLGYRFSLLEATMLDSIAQGNRFHLQFDVENSGFARPFNPRLVEVILRNQANGSLYYLPTDADPRWWASGDTTRVVIEGGVPDSFPSGNYELLLNLPDPMPELHDRWEYSIRLANEGVWEDSTGYNRLNHTVSIGQTACGEAYTGDAWFEEVHSWSSTAAPAPAALPERADITTVYPNPFNAIAMVDFSMAQPGHARLSMVNLLGQEVYTLLDRSLTAGEHSAVLNGRFLPSGLYFLRLRTDSRVAVRKVMLLK